MHGVGPSTVLGGRYAVQRRLETLSHAERWSAHDTTLERDVVVVCFGEDDAHALATLDAARRAAGLDNHRLVRVLDVGRSEGTAFYVEEAIAEAHTLAQILGQGGLPAEEARRIAGETATALEAARARGLHHLRLTPHSVLRAPDGTIKVRGVATAAAMAAEDDVDSARAARLDAVGVVAVTYAALTSRWPLPTPVPGVENAPRVVGGVAAPSEIAAGVPGDLDALCRLTLNDDQGPLTPGDFASQIAPWAPTQVVGLGGSSPRPHDDGLARTIALPMDGAPSSARLREEAPGGAPAPYDQETQVLAAPDQRTQLLPAGGAGPGVGREDGGVGDGQADAGQADAGQADAGQQEGPGAAMGQALGAAGTAAGHAAGAAAHKVGSFAKAAADKAAERRTAREAAARRAEERRISLDEALVENSEPLDPPLPMLHQDTAQGGSDQAKVVLGIVATFLVVVTALGAWGASQIGSGTSLGLGGPSDTATATVTAPATTVTPGQTTSPSASTTTQAGGEEFAILSATGFDPEGDNAERNGEAPRVFDGKAGTFWSSEGYASANLGGLKKGVGVRLDLGQVRKVSKVDLVLPNPSDVTVYVGEDRTLDDATELGSTKGEEGDVSVEAKKPVSGQYVIVWFTSVSQVDDGRFRATLAEVTVR